MSDFIGFVFVRASICPGFIFALTRFWLIAIFVLVVGFTLGDFRLDGILAFPLTSAFIRRS